MQVGIAGLVLTGALVVVIIKALWSARSSAWSVLALGLLFGAGAGALFISVVNEPAVAVPLWTLVGLAVAQPAVVPRSAKTAFSSAKALDQSRAKPARHPAEPIAG
jgi:hypothetical protein